VFVLWFALASAAIISILLALPHWFIVSKVLVGSEGKGNK
jgi:hypothetical protein